LRRSTPEIQEPHRSLLHHRDRLGNFAVNNRPKAHKALRKAKVGPGSKRWRRHLWVLVRRERYVIPNLITSLGLLLGCYSVANSVSGQFYRAAVMIELAALCDGLDGLVARASHTASRFGVEYDSLSDVVAFGVAPASLAYMWALRPLGNVGLIDAGLFVVCGALRLARFNVQTQIGHQHFFVGLPITGAAISIAGLFFLGFRLGLSAPRTFSLLVGLVVPLLASLMVSRVPYPNFKRIRLRRWAREILAVLLIIALALFLIPELTLFAAAAAYLFSGPILRFTRKLRGARAP
jgi:CDP-diacylglycerol---serine O-phosphatidyltransferase